MRNTDTILALAAIGGLQPPRPAMLSIDGADVPVEEASLQGEDHVVTERPGESLVTLEVADWPMMVGRPETVALASRQFERVGSATLVTGDMDGETVLLAVDVGQVYADGLGGHWDVDTLQPADPEGYIATARLAA